MQYKSRKHIPTKAPTYIPVGTPVFFHAHYGKESSGIYLCKGYITRQPTTESPVYKVVVIAINNTSPIATEATRLLGMVIPRKAQEIFREISGWAGKLYDLTSWMPLVEKEHNRIIQNLKRKVVS